MILTAKAGEILDVPLAAAYRLRFKTPFASMEMSAGTLSVKFIGPQGMGSGSIAATFDSSDMILDVTSSMFAGVGLWRLNPEAIIDGLPREWPIAVGLNVLQRGVLRVLKKTGYSPL